MKNNIKSKNVRIGGIGHGEEMININFNNKKYFKFSQFCSKNKLTYNILNKSDSHVLISCNKNIYSLFKDH
ncbi:MAG: hypothetical protein HP044_04885 [Oscillospiraceae bacterium]|nr:hypothetical protein [Oscillospiraceae bacterium]